MRALILSSGLCTPGPSEEAVSDCCRFSLKQSELLAHRPAVGVEQRGGACTLWPWHKAVEFVVCCTVRRSIKGGLAVSVCGAVNCGAGVAATITAMVVAVEAGLAGTATRSH